MLFKISINFNIYILFSIFLRILTLIHKKSFRLNKFVDFQVSAGCASAPCAFGCTSLGGSGYTCGCPQGYQRIGQGHCLSTITPAYTGYAPDIGDVPTFPIDDRYGSASNDKLITTEGCFSCKVIRNYCFDIRMCVEILFSG